MSTISRLSKAAAMALLALASAAHAQPPELPASHQHLGPATCASSACHGRVSPESNANVRLDEYRVWSREDRHARAYQTLLSDASKAIARRLGIGEAHEAKVCLDCHADNVPEAQRGEKFQLSDGVGCEACHGGSEAWLASHAEAGATHADNLDKGLYPLSDVGQRAELCLSCHYGNSEKFAGHDMMAAGHPRLSFELVAFTANQPAHFDFDEDYERRKRPQPPIRLWIEGLAHAVKAQTALLRSERVHRGGLFPELAVFDCHACHHPMDDRRNAQTAVHAGLGQGAVRVNDSSALLLIAALEVFDPTQATALRGELNALHRASARSLADLRTTAASMDRRMDGVLTALQGRSFKPEDLRSLRTALLKRAGAGAYRDFVAAEQAYFAIETLCIELGEGETLKPQLNQLFASLEDEHRFRPDRFSTAAQRLPGAR